MQKRCSENYEHSFSGNETQNRRLGIQLGQKLKSRFSQADYGMVRVLNLTESNCYIINICTNTHEGNKIVKNTCGG